MKTSGVTIIGLTGSIGMGKTTTARMFEDFGIPVWDADAAVHRLYTQNADVISEIGKLSAVATQSGSVDRGALKEWLAVNPDGFSKLEEIVHPRIAADRSDFLRENTSPIAVLDIPLLFELQLTDLVDVVVVVTAPEDIQRKRVLDRGTMTDLQFEAILEKQMPDAIKRSKADFTIETTTLKSARSEVEKIVNSIKEISDA
jgi:dephospho-CoA kinase